MNRRPRHAFAATLLMGAAWLIVGTLRPGALEIGATFSSGNLAFDPSTTSAATGFPGTYFPLDYSVFASQKLSDTISVNGAISADPILQNIAYALVSYSDSHLTIGIGPALGYFNSTTEPLLSGLTATFRLEWPGFAFFSYTMDSTVGGDMSQSGDYLQQSNELSLGYYIPNAICSLNLVDHRFVQKTDAGSTINEFQEYSFKTDLYQKNVPYRVVLKFAYQALSMTFADSPTTADVLGSLVVGTHVEAALSQVVTLVFDVDSAVYTFGEQNFVGLSNPGPSWLDGYLFRASTGVDVNIDRLLNPNGK